MQFRKTLVLSVMALALSMSACAPARMSEAMMEQTVTPESMIEKPQDDPMMNETATDETMKDEISEGKMTEESDNSKAMLDSSTENMGEAPQWFGVELTDVNSGETYTISDLKGKVVLVETMAIWCSNCLRQQKEVMALHEMLGVNEDLISIALDIDPNEDDDALKEYAASKGFDWVYTVAPSEVARELGNLYGNQFLNPPSTPILVIDRSSEVHILPFGIKSADQLYEAIKPFLNEDM